jgi:regulatory protein
MNYKNSTYIPKNYYTYSLRLLTGRDYSKFKLRKKLIEKECTIEEAEQIINKLIEKNYLKENNYINSQVKRLIHKGYSLNNIVYQLNLEKIEISENIILDICEEFNIDYESEIFKLIDRKYYNTKNTKKTLNHFIAKGHSYYNLKKFIDRIENS